MRTPSPTLPSPLLENIDTDSCTDLVREASLVESHNLSTNIGNTPSHTEGENPTPALSHTEAQDPVPHLSYAETEITHTTPLPDLESPSPYHNANSSIEQEFKDPNANSAISHTVESPNSNSLWSENLEIDKGEGIADSEITDSQVYSESGVESVNHRKASFSLWNAVVRGPMRRLQERLLGSRWGSAGDESTKSSIWLLGVCYSGEDDADAPSTEAYADFLIDYSSRIWFTYRKGFEALGPPKMTSDVNWGCMLRSGQMLLAQALVCHYLGRQWRRKPSESNTKEYLKILQCFGDSPSQECPFSIHNIVEIGAPFGLAAGSWLGPYALCRSLEALAHTVRESSDDKSQCKLPMEIYVVSGDAEGGRGGAPCICIDEVESLCLKRDAWTPVLLLVPLVLGLDKVNSRYLPSLWATFMFPQSLGILGGKPGASTYLVGVQGDQAFYLDPHEVQQVLIVSPDNPEVDTSSYHCRAVKRMQLNAIDPSLALGFYCADRESFKDLCKRASELEKDSNGAPMFTVVKSSKKGSIPRGETDELVTSDEPDEDWQIL